jgi:hypothetical protein
MLEAARRELPQDQGEKGPLALILDAVSTPVDEGADNAPEARQ